jgi:hypothetical protein
MPHFPDFTKIDLPPSQGMRVHFGALPATPENAEQIAIPALAVGHAEHQAFAANNQPGFAPFLRGPYPTMYATRPLDDPAICRFFDSAGIQLFLPPQFGSRTNGAVGGVRPANASRL